MPVGTEYYLQSGYISINGAHCVYIALVKQDNNKILIRLDNRWIQKGRIDGERHETTVENGIEVIRPYCVGIVTVTDNRLRVYITGVIEALFELDPQVAMNKLYDKDKKLPKLQDMSFTQSWPFQAKQPGNASNCTMSSHNFGIMCRQGQEFAAWMENQENSLIWQKSKEAAPNPASSTTSVGHHYRGETQLDSTVLSSSNSPTPITIPSHEELMRNLAQKLGVEYKEVYTGSAVEQALVGLAGISTSQVTSSYHRQEDGTTVFSLSFSNAIEFERFITYFNQNFPRFIKGTYIGDNQPSKIVVNTQILYAQIANSMEQFVMAKRNNTGKNCSIS